MAVTNIPNVQNWTVTPQNGQTGYFDLMNTWLGQSTLVIASLQSAITAQNAANIEINNLASQVTLDTSTTVTAKNEAVSALALLSSGSINDTTIGTDKAYSNSKVNSIIKKRKNYLINGNFQFWDYLTIGVTSQTTSGYGSDNRFDNKHIGSTKVHTKQTSTDTERALFESPYYSRTVVSSVAGAGNGTFKIQRIEDVTKLAGKTVTFSVFGRADATKNIAVYFNQNFGTGGSPSSTVMGISPNTLSLSTNISKKTFTVTFPSLIGKTLGTDGTHTSYTELVICFEAGSNFNSYTNSLGQQSGTFDIAEVKLEDGLVATDGWAPYDGEWGSEAIARMRYYQKINGEDVNFTFDFNTLISAHYNNASPAGRRYRLPTGLRVIPTVTVIGLTHGFTGSGAPNVTATSNAFIISLNPGTTGFTNPFVYIISAYLSAEL